MQADRGCCVMVRRTKRDRIQVRGSALRIAIVANMVHDARAGVAADAARKLRHARHVLAAGFGSAHRALRLGNGHHAASSGAIVAIMPAISAHSGDCETHGASSARIRSHVSTANRWNSSSPIFAKAVLL